MTPTLGGAGAADLEIKGVVEHSLVDWGGRIATVLFLPGCNFRCPWCYARRLVLEPERLPTLPLKSIEEHLRAHRRFIDGIVLTGGEPTLQPELARLCTHLKRLGFDIKLDTNGSSPNALRALIKQRLVDYVAMDIKAPLNAEAYERATGGRDAIKEVAESIKLLQREVVAHEFRTTIVPGLHTPSDIEAIARLVGDAKWALQPWLPKAGALIDPLLARRPPLSEAEMRAMHKRAQAIAPHAVLRRAPQVVS